MTKPTFSIVTTTFNRLDSGFLQQNIDSVRLSSKKAKARYEHIIIDDGSTDGTKGFVEQLAKKDISIRYIYQENKGVAAATQNGLKRASGEFVIILDDDDYLTEESISARLKYINNNSDVDFFYGKAYWVDNLGLPINPLFQSVDHGKWLYEEMLIGNCINAGTPTIRTSVIKAVQWPEWISRSQDYFLWLEILRPEAKTKVGYINDKVVNYRYHNANYTTMIDDDLKKSAKAELNNRIRDLHPKDLVYIAKKAREWIDEAHASNEYRLLQLKDKDDRIDELQNALNHYAHSRLVKATIKGRNVIRGQVFDRLGRARYRLNDIRMGSSGTPSQSRKSAEYVNIESWDDKRPLVSVITPFYNRQDTMPDTIRSVLSQTFQNFEYIIVNDGSPDEEAREYLSRVRHDKIAIIHQENQGVAEARNTGIRNARGKYIVCLDSDDLIDSTYLEKAVILLESQPGTSVATCDMQMFGKKTDSFVYSGVDPIDLINDNPVITAATFRREVWEKTGGYKKDIGYEDWEFWVSVAEQGFEFAHIPEKLFLYRTAEVSRYVEDLLKHTTNSTHIKRLHPDFRRKAIAARKFRSATASKLTKSEQIFSNMTRTTPKKPISSKKRVLIAVPWMTFGGAETLILNYCKQVAGSVDISFVTAIPSEHEWEYKFKTLTEKIYHLDSMFTDERSYIEFISYMIREHDIDTLHIVHSGYVFSMLKELKSRHPKIEVIVTLFNDRTEYFKQSIETAEYIDKFSTDNTTVSDHFQRELPKDTNIRVIPNGVDNSKVFNPETYNREENRRNLTIKEDEIAVFFVGRLSEEKNPDVFIEVAKTCLETGKPFKFFVIGDGPMREDIEMQISRTGYEESIAYLGYKTEVAEYLSAADIFVLPSSIEGFPLSILEAMSMGVVPVASRVGAVPDVIKEGKSGYVVDPGAVSQFVETLIKLEGDRTQLEVMKKEVRVRILKQYSNEDLGRNYKKLYGVES